jgi:rubredoxin
VVDADVVGDGRPMTYEHYHKVKGGKSPKTAPTYVSPEESKPEKEKEMSSYTCSVCGYVYNPAEGDSEGGVPAGTAFEDLPESWVCPVCGAPKTEFSKA